MLETGDCPVHEHECPPLFIGRSRVVLLIPSHFFCFPLTELVLCMNTGSFFNAHTEWTASRLWGDICWIWQKVYWIRIADFTFKVSQSSGLSWGGPCRRPLQKLRSRVRITAVCPEQVCVEVHCMFPHLSWICGHLFVRRTHHLFSQDKWLF